MKKAGHIKNNQENAARSSSAINAKHPHCRNKKYRFQKWYANDQLFHLSITDKELLQVLNFAQQCV